MRNKLLLVSIITIITFILVPQAKAEEATINSNSSNSSNNLNTLDNNQVTAIQNNQAAIGNSINANANSGGNIAGTTTADKTTIATGNVSQISTIINNVNLGVISQTCCLNEAQSININGNGFSSRNTVTAAFKDQTTISILQNAAIINNIKNTSNTGNNTAENNKGNVYINTGAVSSSIKINNFVNLGIITYPENSGNYTNVDLTNNAAESDNQARSLEDQNLKTLISQTADVENDLNLSENTGYNKAGENAGIIIIKTGDIISNAVVQNEINKNVLGSQCCIQNSIPFAPSTSENNSGQPQQQPQSQPVSSLPPLQSLPLSQTMLQPLSHSQALANAHAAGMAIHVGSIAGNNSLFFSKLGNIIMYFFGAYLRLRSGNSPGLLLIS